ncbi:MAG: tRNA-dihydrouridine synthase [Defluviitaleaceae bacterium]|nr:tRNA-dihydrouridine synthase [Defluviitaleaceae bacterium]
MLKPVKLGSKEVWPPFTFPSGIVTVSSDLMLRAANDIGIGLITAKSVGAAPRDGYNEPLFSQYSIDSLSTAVGLSNPGADAWIEEMKDVDLPKDKYLLVSIFSDKVDEFVEIARKISPYCDGIELNFCCPHSLDYGAAVATEDELTAIITKAVRAAVDNYLVVKLTPDGPAIGPWAKKLVEAGADAIAAIGPTKAVTVVDEHTGQAILSYGSGGLSGPDILETGINCVKEMRKYVDVPIIGGGGIRGASDVRAYAEAGADIFAIGTSLAGLDTPMLREYFQVLQQDLVEGTDNSTKMAFYGWQLKHTPMTVKSVTRQGEYATLVFDGQLEAEPGQFVFAWLPGIGEKPFGVAACSPFTLGVRRVGKVSGALCDLEPGAEVMIRGPFGKAFPASDNAVIIAGGCGAVPLRLFAESCDNPTTLLGARTLGDVLFADDFKGFGETFIATDDGTSGFKGNVVELLKAKLESGCFFKDADFFICGPEPMMAAAAKLLATHTSDTKIYLGLERYVSCGVGLCGKCALDGYRTCIDGPVMRLDQLGFDGDFGNWHRTKAGTKIRV